MARWTTRRCRSVREVGDRGASAVEYGLIMAGVVVGLIVVAFALNAALKGAYTATQSGLEAAPPTPTNTDPATWTPPPVPSTPTGVTASAGDGQVSLAWVGSTGATSYNVYGCGASPVSISSTSYTCTGLTNGTPYSFTVSAVNATGESGKSSPVSATPAAPISLPTAPTGVTATSASASASITWVSVSGASSYTVYGCGASPFSTSSASFLCTGLTDGTVYSVYVTATNVSGESGPSVTVRIGWPPAGATVVAPAGTTAPITVSPALASGYTLSNNPGCTYSPALLPSGTITANATNTGSGNGATATSMTFTVPATATHIQPITATCTYKNGNSTDTRTFKLWIS